MKLVSVQHNLFAFTFACTPCPGSGAPPPDTVVRIGVSMTVGSTPVIAMTGNPTTYTTTNGVPLPGVFADRTYSCTFDPSSIEVALGEAL